MLLEGSFLGNLNTPQFNIRNFHEFKDTIKIKKEEEVEWEKEGKGKSKEKTMLLPPELISKTFTRKILNILCR